MIVGGGALVCNNPRRMRRWWEHWSIGIQEGRVSDGGRRS